MNYSAVLDTYELSEIIELNDLTQEDVLEYLVEHKILHLPDIMPVIIEWLNLTIIYQTIKQWVTVEFVDTTKMCRGIND